MKMLRTLVSGGAAVSVAGAGLLASAGVAGAVPDIVDRPYKDAKRMIQRSGGTPVIATRTGNGASEDNCLVANAWEAAVRRPNSRGRPSDNNEVMVALNCNGELAEPGSPGNSAANPVGRAAKTEAQQEAAERAKRAQARASTPGA